MSKFKLNFKSTKVDMWRYQDEELEKMYLEFVKETEQNDAQLHTDFNEW